MDLRFKYNILFYSSFWIIQNIHAQSFDPKLSISGQHSIEYFHTNYRIPQFGISNIYCRMLGQSNLTVYELPFNVSYFTTTEPQTIYKTNYINVNFDKEAFTNEIEKYKNQKIEESQQRIQTKKSKLNLELSLDSLNTSMYTFDYSINSEQIRIKKQTLDSLRNNHSFKQADEIQQLQEQIEKLKVDSSYLEFQKKQQSIKRLEKIKTLEKLDSMFQADTAYFHSLKNISPGDFDKQFLIQKLGVQNKTILNLLPVLQKIKKLDMGSVNPIYGPYSFNGNGIRGIHLGLKIDRIEYEIVAGKCQALNLNSFSRFSTDYNGWAYGIKSNFATKQFENSLYSHLILFGTDIRNSVFGFSSKLRSLQTFDIQMGFAWCLDNSNSKLLLDAKQSEFNSFIQDKAIELIVSKALWKVKLESINKAIGLNYRNFGNPFMIKGLYQNEIKMKSTLFGQALNVAIFYKNIQYVQFNEGSFPMISRGFGFSSKTNFKSKWLPNASINYTPFEQGNNHPDSLFMVYTKTSVITASIFKNYSLNKNWFMLSQISYLKNQVQINRNYHFNSENLNTNIQVQSKSGFMANLSWIYVTSTPRIDSLQSITTMGNILWGKDKLRIGLNLLETKYFNGGKRISIMSNLQWQIRSAQYFSINLSYEYINKIWSLYSKDIYAINLKYVFKFNLNRKNVNNSL